MTTRSASRSSEAAFSAATSRKRLRIAVVSVTGVPCRALWMALVTSKNSWPPRNDLPPGRDPQVPEERNEAVEELGDAAADRRGIHHEQAISLQAAGQLSYLRDGGGADDRAVVVQGEHRRSHGASSRLARTCCRRSSVDGTKKSRRSSRSAMWGQASSSANQQERSVVQRPIRRRASIKWKNSVRSLARRMPSRSSASVAAGTLRGRSG